MVGVERGEWKVDLVREVLKEVSGPVGLLRLEAAPRVEEDRHGAPDGRARLGDDAHTVGERRHLPCVHLFRSPSTPPSLFTLQSREPSTPLESVVT